MSLSNVSLVAAALAVSMTNASPNPHSMEEDRSYFMSYIAKYDKNYVSVEEFRHRLGLFAQTQEYIRSHNARAHPHSFVLGHNQFSDWTRDEQANLFGYHMPSEREGRDLNERHLTPNNDNSIDWRDHDQVVGPIRNEYEISQCQACWAFAVTAMMESAHAIKNQEWVQLSPQQLVDCDHRSMGCRGGGTDSSIDYYRTSQAIKESDYPYVSRTQMCQYSAAKGFGLNVTQRINVPQMSVTQLKAAVAKQPITAALAGSSTPFLQYKTGVFDSPLCTTKLDHAVVIVGFGVDSTTSSEFWIVRNDWGSDWGEAGYMRLKIQDGQGICGVNMAASYGLVTSTN